MDKKRKAYAPFSLTSEAGVAQTPVEGYIDVNQSIYPIVNTGVVNENGKWTGVTANDNEFIALQKDENVANGTNTVSNETIDMAKHNFLMVAIKPSAAGNYKFQLLLSNSPEAGDDSYYNLKPVDGGLSAFTTQRSDASTHNFDFVLDVTQSCDANVWSVFKVDDCKGFKLLLHITNNTGGPADIEQAYMRILE